MVDNVSSIEHKMLAVLQQGLPRSQRPYEDMARQIGIETGQLLRILSEWKRQGKLRRIGAILNHFKIGLGAGAMVVWRVEPERVQEVGEILAKFEEVSHAYERHVSKDWPYSVYTMVHAKSPEDVQQVILRMSQACGISNYRILVTERELKKVPPTYITHSGAQNAREEGRRC